MNSTEAITQLFDQLNTLQRRVDDIYLPEVVPAGGTAASDAEYLTLALHAGLTQERVFTPGDGLDGVDAGANSTYTLSVDVTDIIDTNYGLTENANNIRINAGTGLQFVAGALATNDSQINHANLNNLNSANYWHLTQANHTDLTDGGETSLHYHLAANIPIVDAGGYFAVDNVEAALQQIGAAGGGTTHTQNDIPFGSATGGLDESADLTWNGTGLGIFTVAGASYPLHIYKAYTGNTPLSTQYNELNKNNNGLSTTDMYGGFDTVTVGSPGSSYTYGCLIGRYINSVSLIDSQINGSQPETRGQHGIFVKTTFSGDSNSYDMSGIKNWAIVDGGGTISGNFYGIDTLVEISSGAVTNDVYGHRLDMSTLSGISGTAYGYYLNDGAAVDYGFYQAGSNPNVFGGNVDAASFTISDVQWYRNVANVWRTPDGVIIDGNLGVNVATALYPLHISGNSYLAGTVYHTSNNGTNPLYIMRTTAITESAKFYVDDRQLIVESIQDESTAANYGGILFRLGNIATQHPEFRISDYRAGSDVILFDLYDTGKLSLTQPSATNAVPVLQMTQTDVSEEFIRFIGTAAASTLTQSIVAAGDVSTATIAGYLRVYVQDDGNQITDQAYYMPIYTLA